MKKARQQASLINKKYTKEKKKESDEEKGRGSDRREKEILRLTKEGREKGD